MATYERLLVSSILEGVFSALIVLPISVFLGLRYGGIACLQHLILRVLLWHYDFAPWRYVQFLNYASERVLLRKVGGGYYFIHRELRDYFSALHLQEMKV